MKLNAIFLLSTVLLILNQCASHRELDDFDLVKNQIPTIELEVRYIGNHNFTGRPVVGYEQPVVYLTKQATTALQKVQEELKLQGLGLKIFDGFRPQMAVDSFEVWAKDVNDTIAKQEFYPDVDKRDLFTLGYIASKSGHSRGSTVDVTIINLQTKQELDMGSAFDFFGVISHQDTPLITPEQKANRLILKQAMLKQGFKEYQEEWWHFTLIDEPFPNTYFNFPVK